MLWLPATQEDEHLFVARSKYYLLDKLAGIVFNSQITYLNLKCITAAYMSYSNKSEWVINILACLVIFSLRRWYSYLSMIRAHVTSECTFESLQMLSVITSIFFPLLCEFY